MAGSDKSNPGNPVPGAAIGGSNDDEPPLDPAVERIRRKLVRLLLGSFGIMILGLIAVFSTIVYRLSDDTAPSGATAANLQVTADVPLPAGTEILSTSVSGQRTLLHISVPGEDHGQLIVIETDSGKVIGRYRLQEISAE